MNEPFDLQRYLTRGVEKIVANAVKAALRDPRESAFLLRFSAASRRASERRAKLEAAGEHIPPFLIASITNRCNLHCAGCYARCGGAAADGPASGQHPASGQMSAEQWEKIFREADTLGVSFILLAGGEPLLRRDVIEAAGGVKDVLFPIFTNGTFLDENYLALFARRRNLLPVLSLEGGRDRTDARRGEGVYEMLTNNMERLREKGVLFGASITVTKENLREVTADAFLADLAARGCKLVIYVEYVPVAEESRSLAPGDKERSFLESALVRLRERFSEIVFLSFPGDEKRAGGCLAAGRGFFHVNANGGAEPCPFSPYSDCSVAETSLREALRSTFFTALREGDLLSGEHEGGCVLFENRDRVEALLSAPARTDV